MQPGYLKREAEGLCYWLSSRVYYEDTDASGIVYHANYLRFLERARTEWLRAIDVHQDELRDECGVVFVITGMQIDYRRPAKFNDALMVSAVMKSYSKARMEFVQGVYRDEDANATVGELLVPATAQAACIRVDNGRPTRFPALLLERLAAAQQAA